MLSLCLLRRIGAGALVASAVALAPLAATTASAHTTGPSTGAQVSKSGPHTDKSSGGRFKLGSASIGGGSAAVMPDGAIVAAYDAKDSSVIDVCAMSADPTKCSSTAELHPYHTDGFGTPQVVPTGGKDVSIVVEDCCYIGSDGVIVYNSTNDGKSFSNYVIAGNLPAIASALYIGGGHILISDASTAKLEVQEISDNPSRPTGIRISPPRQGDDDESALSSYKGGVLLGTSDNQTTVIDYAKSGSNYDSRSAWKQVEVLRQSELESLSGNAILVAHAGSITGDDRVAFFNGTKFGTQYRVSQPPSPDDGGFFMQETGSVAHVFYVARRDSYRLYETSTSNGTWSAQTAFASVTDNTDMAPALASSGKGIVLLADGPPAIQTITNGQ